MMSRRKSRLCSSQKPAFPLLELPEDVLLHLMSLLQPSDRKQLRLTCHQVRDLVDNAAVWKNRQVELVPKTTFNEEFWNVLAHRGLTSVALYPRSNTTPACLAELLRRLLVTCPRLHTLAVSANVAWYLVSILKSQPYQITTLHVGALCYDRNSSELLENLTKLSSLEHLHLFCINYPSISRLAVCVPQLPNLETLSLETLMPNCTNSSEVDLYLGHFLQALPKLKVFNFSHKACGIPNFFVYVGSEVQVPLCFPETLALDIIRRNYMNEMLESHYFSALYSELSMTLYWCVCTQIQQLRLTLTINDSCLELEAVFKAIAERCPNLRTLKLAFTLCGASMMNWVKLLPETLTNLSLERHLGNDRLAATPCNTKSQLGPSGHSVVSKLSPILQQKLEKLELVNLALTPGGVMHIGTNMPNLRQLRATVVTTISREYVESFRKLLPQCHLRLCSVKS